MPLPFGSFMEERDRCRDRNYVSQDTIIREGYFCNTDRRWDFTSQEQEYEVSLAPPSRPIAQPGCWRGQCLSATASATPDSRWVGGQRPQYFTPAGFPTANAGQASHTWIEVTHAGGECAHECCPKGRNNKQRHAYMKQHPNLSFNLNRARRQHLGVGFTRRNVSEE